MFVSSYVPWLIFPLICYTNRHLPRIETSFTGAEKKDISNHNSTAALLTRTKSSRLFFLKKQSSLIDSLLSSPIPINFPCFLTKKKKTIKKKPAKGTNSTLIELIRLREHEAVTTFEHSKSYWTD